MSRDFFAGLAEALASADIPLAQFVREAWHVIEPDTPLIWGWSLDAICEHLEALLTGTLGRQNLMILVPPGSMKSTIVSVCAPAWMWIHRPAWRAIFASGNPAVSVRDSLRCRAIIDSPWYRTRFGIRWALAADQNLKTRYANSATGSRVAISSQTRVTGDRGDSIFVDDPLDADLAYSESERSAVNAWWDQAFGNRLNDLARGTRCVIQQRLHTDDLAGHILAREAAQWEVLCIPQLFEEARRTTTSLGWTDPRTSEGELMFPERFPRAQLEVERLRLGESGFAGQHQQRPFAASGEVFKVGRLQSWAADALPAFTQTIIVADTAYGTRQTNDYTVAVVLGQFERGLFLLDVVRGRYAYPQLKETLIALAARWRPNAVVIEDVGSGKSVLQDLQQNTALPLWPVKPEGDKLSRAHVIVPTWESGRVFAPEGAPWLGEFLEELYAFPKAPHDDQVDAFVHGVKHLTGDADLEIWRILGAADRAPAPAPAPPPPRPADPPEPEDETFMTVDEAAALLRGEVPPVPVPEPRIIPLGQHLREQLAAAQHSREIAAARARAENEARLEIENAKAREALRLRAERMRAEEGSHE